MYILYYHVNTKKKKAKEIALICSEFCTSSASEVYNEVDWGGCAHVPLRAPPANFTWADKVTEDSKTVMGILPRVHVERVQIGIEGQHQLARRRFGSLCGFKRSLNISQVIWKVGTESVLFSQTVRHWGHCLS